MFRAKTSLLKIILSLSVLNFGSLILFFFHPDFFRLHPPLERENGSRHESTTVFVSEDPNSWPTLPSYLPWKQTKDVPTGSCEKYFGNGFTKQIDVLHVPVELGDRKSPGWFRCFFSETLRSSICEGSSLRMNPTKIRMSDGGESLESVMGRTEESELPVFEPGAFEIDGGPAILKDRKLVEKMFLDKYMPSGKTMRDLVDSTRLVNSARFKCAEWVEQPTLLVTRFEYANIFHTVTDWYSAYVASRVTDLPYRPHVVFVDGHCRAPLEEAWLAMFSSLRYAKNSTGPLCFRHAILTPLGYETALFKGLSESIPCRGTSAWELKENLQHDRTARLSEFGEMVASSFRLPVDEKKKKTSVRDVVFVRREDYLAHPRHAGEIESRLSNEQQVFDYLKKWVSAYKKCEVNLVNGRFANMTMRSQVKAIRNASVVIGAHGAGLTHIIAANPSAVVLEIISSHVRRPHFALISQWKGLEYHAISLSGSHADPREVADHLKNILEALAC